MSKVNAKLKGFMVTVTADGDVSCVETNHRYMDIYVMAFSEETPTTLRFLVNGEDEANVIEKAKAMAKDVYSRRKTAFPYLGKSYRSLDVFKKTPIQLCAESFKTVYFYEWDDMIHPKDTDKLPEGFAHADGDVHIREKQPLRKKKLSRWKIFNKTAKTLMTKGYTKRINAHIKKMDANDDILIWAWHNEIPPPIDHQKGLYCPILRFRCFYSTHYMAGRTIPFGRILSAKRALLPSSRREKSVCFL